MFRVQHQVAANQWVDLTKSPTGSYAQGLAAVRRMVTADSVRVVQNPAHPLPDKGAGVDLVV